MRGAGAPRPLCFARNGFGFSDSIVMFYIQIKLREVGEAPSRQAVVWALRVRWATGGGHPGCTSRGNPSSQAQTQALDLGRKSH